MSVPFSEYQIDLDTFRGPLDLLLFLVKRQEVDIRDIPIARVAAQFQEYLRVIETIDVERAGDFLVMAATLMEIKSRMLLPADLSVTQPADDPRQELVRQLLEYKRFKDAALLLEQRAERQMERMPRAAAPPERDLDPVTQPLRAVELWDLVSAFGRLMRETLGLAPQQIVVDETPIQFYQEEILARLASTVSLNFTDVFVPPRTRARMIGIFLAILELIKAQRISAEQTGEFSEIRLRPVRETATPSSSDPP
jgi:segregation and condensation protein A